ncbi:MAG: cytochrome P450 [Myxococcota bacterium]
MPSHARPPGPPPRKGGLQSLPYYLRFVRDPLGFVGSRFERYGDIYYAPSDDQGLFVLRHPEHMRRVLATDSASYAKTHSAFNRLQQVLGQGLLTLDGDAWKRHRRMIQPAFNRAALAGYGETMVEEADRCVSRWSAGQQLDLAAEMTELTLRIVARTLFSHDVGGETGDVADAMRTFNATMGRPDLLPKWMPSPARSRVRHAIERLDHIVYDLIDARAGAPAKPDLLQMLVDAVDGDGDGGKLTRKEVHDELVTLFLAGHETTSNALAWTTYLLSKNEGAAARLFDEVHGVLAGRLPTLEDLDAMPLLEQTLRESMRLYPPAYVVARQAVVDTEIGDYAVPAGAEIVLWIYWTHRDARWYPQPAQFRPERFEADAVAARPKLSYLPFGGGPRACIGAQFSMVEAQLVLAVLVSRWRLQLPSGAAVRPRTGVTLTPKGGLPMIVRPAETVRRAG